jgi:hypothetical protein
MPAGLGLGKSLGKPRFRNISRFSNFFLLLRFSERERQAVLQFEVPAETAAAFADGVCMIGASR